MLLYSLISAFRETKYIMIFVMNYTIALYKDSPNIYVLFDSHPRDTAEMRGECGDGKAIVMFFRCIEDVVSHIKNYASSLGYAEDNACYNILACDVDRRCASHRDRSHSIVYVSNTKIVISIAQVQVANRHFVSITIFLRHVCLDKRSIYYPLS